jgi:hypothetical protein
MEKAAAINPVVLVIVRNVVGHNFFFRLMIGICFTSILTELIRVYSQKSWRLGAGLAIFAKTPRLGVGLKRGV